MLQELAIDLLAGAFATGGSNIRLFSTDGTVPWWLGTMVAREFWPTFGLNIYWQNWKFIIGKLTAFFTSACPEGTSHCCRLLATKRFINASLHSRPTAAVGFQSKNISNVSKDRLTSFPWDKAGESSCNGLGPGWWYFASVQCGWGKRMNNCRVADVNSALESALRHVLKLWPFELVLRKRHVPKAQVRLISIYRLF